jgi:hypothetical protein
MKAMAIRGYGQHDARRRLVRLSTELQKLYFQTRPEIRLGTELFIQRTQGLEPLAGAGGIEPPNGGIKISLII